MARLSIAEVALSTAPEPGLARLSMAEAAQVAPAPNLTRLSSTRSRNGPGTTMTNDNRA